jgi:4-hydroxysphinganine ceramide fatty acyl 2-hydroxylase
MVVSTGNAAYALVEYMTHRFFFHMKPPKNLLLLKLIKRLHYDHHVEPDELHLLFLPLWYTVPSMFVSSLLTFIVTSNVPLTASFMTGVLFMLLYYEWTHYVAHRPLKPLTFWGKWMKRLHLLHHFKNENYWYGVTTPTFDVLMGTFKDDKEVEKSETARNLEQQGISR